MTNYSTKMMNIIPYKFFICKGAGEDDYDHHAGSYHIALRKAGIHNCNIIPYSSILPKEAIEVPVCPLHFGQELKVISSVCNGFRGNALAAGIAYNWLYDDDGVKIGGLVVERSGFFDEGYLADALNNSWYSLYNDSYSHLHYSPDEMVMVKQIFVPDRQYGTAFTALCFVEFLQI